MGVNAENLRFFWVPVSEKRGDFQSAYQINLELNGNMIWDTGKVESSQPKATYSGASLRGATAYRWRVRLWDGQGGPSDWSNWQELITGLSPTEWKGKWISGGQLIRREFEVKGAKRALLFVSALGYYEVRLNGKKVGDKVLDPGWSDYNKRVYYSVYDVTELLKEKNAVGVMLGHSRYIQKYGYQGAPALIFQLKIEKSDGQELLIVSDESWKCADGPIVSDDVYDGETYDARLEKEGWDTPDYDDSSWKQARVEEAPKCKLVPELFEPIRVVGSDKPVSCTNPKPGIFIYDFGKNFTGWVKIKARGEPGSAIKIRYAELLNPDGTLNTATMNDAKATDTYIFRGYGLEEYAPRFTYRGFRYAEVTGYPGVPSIEGVEREIVHTDVEPIGGFYSSNDLINKIHELTVRGQLSNLMSIPTDCPQRNERMGWMGDAQLSAEEAMFNFWMPSFYESWLDEIEESQKEDGEIPDVVPPYWNTYPADPAWGIAYLEIAWLLYLYYGDTKPIADHYESMKRWVNYLTSRAKDGILEIKKYGDWCPPMYSWPPATPLELTDTWYYHHSLVLLSKMADLLGKGEESRDFLEKSQKVADAFNSAFFKKDHYGPETGRNSSQTADLLPLWAGIAKEKDAVAKHLIREVEVEHDRHLNTGIVGTRYLFDVLADVGRPDLAYAVVTQKSYPGYGYMLREGATTLWEHWEYTTTIGSHNHIMLGSVDSWFYRRLAGISVDEKEPGFSHIVFRPGVFGPKYAAAELRTVKGLVGCEWRVDDKAGKRVLAIKVSVPVNCRGTIYLPPGSVKGADLSGPTERGTIEVGSGVYEFEVELA
ncbi:MAG: family 78 glycoside hydrolase catalytic domain [Thermoprotei archaeon]